MRKQLLGAILAGVFCAGIAFAQGPVMKDQSRDMAKEEHSMSPEKMAQHWQENTARCLLLGNQAEVLMSEFALEHVQNPELKEFAQSMVKNHNECIAKLERYVPGAPSTEALGKWASTVRSELKMDKGTMPVSSEMGDTSKKMEPPMSSMAHEGKMMGMEGKNFMHAIPAMQQQMAANCIAYTQAELSQLDKDRFDRAYLGQQIFFHIDTLAKLKALENFSPAELKPIIDSEITATQTHLEQAKNICKQWDAKTAKSENKKNY
jgi:predicted outer membrane protein